MSNEKGIPEFLSADNVSNTPDNTFSVYRSIAVGKPENDHVFHSFQNPSFVKASDVSNAFGKLQVAEKLPEVNLADLDCPDRPFSLMRTHFELDTSKMNSAKDGKSKFVKIVEALMKCLNDFSDYDFSFFEEDCMWKGKFLSGSSYCEMHVHIYKQTPPAPVFIIEANRVEGDSKPFFAFYREFKSLMLNCPQEHPSNQFFFEPLPTTKISPEQFLGGVKPIFAMSVEPFFESRLEAAKMLCDLAKHPEKPLLQLEECRKNCVSCLAKLVEDDFELVKQHAMCALSEFVEVAGYPEEMLSSPALHVLFDYMQTQSEPAYETIQARRECARALQVLAKHNCQQLRLALDPSELQQFSSRVNSLKDKKLVKLATVVSERLAAASPLTGSK